MSRAINVAVAEQEVLNACRMHGAEVSAIETLASGGTRVVLTNSDGAAIMKLVFGAKLLTGAVRRMPLRTWSL